MDPDHENFMTAKIFSPMVFARKTAWVNHALLSVGNYAHKLVGICYVHSTTYAQNWVKSAWKSEVGL